MTVVKQMKPRKLSENLKKIEITGGYFRGINTVPMYIFEIQEFETRLGR